ncbi:KN motif and ankyrin repeat domain-containing protein 2 isoform X2 [Drosophila tropicalis]|uniref:KN motif and ankyrin repeat domain-containing protein 2 isoform X2 n=1 Tax=Drosophila tropicalis TaxID=46794 RepID=UPI0035AC28F0
MSLVLRSQRAFIEENVRSNNDHSGNSSNNNSNGVGNPSPSSIGKNRSVRSCNCCPYGYHIDLDFVRYCESLAQAKPSEDEIRRRDRRRSRKSMEFMLGFESLFGGDWQADARVEPKLTEAVHESEPDSPCLTAAGGGVSQPYLTTPCYRPRSSSVPRFTYGSIPPRSESPFGTASSTCSSLRGGVESDAGVYQSHRPAISPPETRAFLHEALDEVCSDFERTLERTSVKRRKAVGNYNNNNNYNAGSMSMDRNNNNLNNGYGRDPYKDSTRDRRLGHATWDRHFDVADSCIAGNRSPSTTPRLFMRSNTLPLQQRPSPAEVQYESYVQATVAANAKSPVEQSLEATTPPPPPPRRYQDKPKVGKENGGVESPLVSPVNSEGGQTQADAQALYQIREQMALSLKRLKDLEEQVKAIPDMELELTTLRTEKQRLLRKNEELVRGQRQTPSPSSPGGVSNNKTVPSPVQFTPQRISPVSLESLGTRIRSTSNSASPSPTIRRDVGIQAAAKVTATRDIAVGSSTLNTRHVGTQQAEAIYSQLQLQEKIDQVISKQKEENTSKLISVGTQMYIPQREQREMGSQTKAERPKLTYNVGINVKPATRENFTSCKPEVRSVASSEDRVNDVLCEKCAVSKRSVASGPEEPLINAEKAKPAAAANPPQMPGRSNTFSLGESESLSLAIKKRKHIGCQTPETHVHSSGTQTSATTVRSTGAQVTPEQKPAAVQCVVQLRTSQTDTIDLQQRLSRSVTKSEEIAEPKKPLSISHTASNTDEMVVPKKVERRSTSHSACNTEQVDKRDVGCGDIVKPHISIACAANYCDSCKEAIQELAKDFTRTNSRTQSSPAAKTRRSTSADSRIPRPKQLPSPSPARRELKRQNTYTLVTPSTTPSPKLERKALMSSLQEKPPNVSSFQTLDSSGESQSFIKQPSNKQPSLDLSQLGEDELVVREEKRVSISWSRDASPAPLMSASYTLSTSSPEQQQSPEKEEEHETDQAVAAASSSLEAQIAQGARNKSSTPLKSSQSEESQITVIERPPTKAQLHQLAQSQSEPRQKTVLSKEFKDALKVINDSLLKKLGSKPFSSISLKSSKAIIQDNWFRNSSTGKSDPNEVEDYLDHFETLSVPLLEYCVNLTDENGNTAMHYAVSHANFDVVSILLDSKVCNVNQMNNAGYTSVMLVSLAKLKQPSHRTVVERLFQMADVNIRAKKHCQTALMLAVSHGNSDMVNLLLSNGADINIQDEDGSTALMCAAEHGRLDIVKYLLSNPDCDSIIQDVDGSTAFKIAWQAGHRDVGLLLYVHEQMLRSKLPNRGDSSTTDPVTAESLKNPAKK